jgi:hypothetical protein
MYDIYKSLCLINSDINEHLPTLYRYSLECESILECGVRNLIASWAFLYGLSNNNKVNKKLILNNTIECNITELLSQGVNIESYWINDLELNIDPVDLTFIDTWHIYGQLKRELNKFKLITNKYIIIHYTSISPKYGDNKYQDLINSGFSIEEIKKGIWPVIEEFLNTNRDWILHERFTNNNGLTVLKKINTGFIILRHVNNLRTNNYWNHCYNCIRKYYPEHPILIIDDNSNYEYISEQPLYKTHIIKSEYPGRGELLPYYYYLHNKLFDTAVIIHDSVFVNKYIDLNVNKYKIIWDFEHDWDQIEDETKMIKLFNDSELLNFYEDKELWKGCFGCMSIIKHDYLKYINNKYDISKLLNCVLTRYNRQSFERVIACLLQKNEKEESLLGNLHKYSAWGSITYEEKDNYKHLPLIKVWTCR